MKKKILKERRENKNERLKLYSYSSINRHILSLKSLSLAIIYVTLFILIVFLQLQLENRFDQTRMKESFKKETFNPTSGSTKSTILRELER